MLAKAKKAAGIVVLGALGFGLAFVALHLWIDHKALHVLFSIEQARQAQYQKGAPK